ncbi:MAG TPA: hypothetical protein VHD36_14520 [Pirellulales bacterium]|nr:hypothetical protein [Pirellulales bacterium]
MKYTFDPTRVAHKPETAESAIKRAARRMRVRLATSRGIAIVQNPSEPMRLKLAVPKLQGF